MSFEEYRREISRRLSPGRAQHSFNVAAEAVRLAEKYGADPVKAEIAGLLHDCMKETSAKEQLQLLEQFGIIVGSVELCSHKLLHAMTGALVAETEFGVTDPDVVQAIRYHTTGKAGMSLLEKIIYIADFISADRTFNGVEALRACAYRDLDAALIEGLSFTIGDLAAKSRPVHEDTIRAYNELVCARDAAERRK